MSAGISTSLAPLGQEQLVCSIGGPAAVPPSTGTTIPVIWADRSPARKSTALATSAGVPWRCSGWAQPDDRAEVVVGDPSADVTRSDAVDPDAVLGQVCQAADRLNWMTAALEVR